MIKNVELTVLFIHDHYFAGKRVIEVKKFKAYVIFAASFKDKGIVFRFIYAVKSIAVEKVRKTVIRYTGISE